MKLSLRSRNHRGEAIPNAFGIPRGVYPERKDEILRSAQNDKRRARNDRLGWR